MENASTATAPIYSSLGADPDLGELVEMFVEEMPDRIQSLIEASNTSDQEALRYCAHQLKGAAGSYGFDQITPYAATLENALGEDQVEADIKNSLDSLVDACRRIRAGSPE